MNKREFVLAAGGSLLTGGGRAATTSKLNANAAAATGAASPTLGGQQAAWQRRVGDHFEVFGHGAATTLVLRQVHAHRSDGQTEQFSLVFARSGKALASGTHVLRHVGGSPVALYLTQAQARVKLADTGEALLRADCCLLV